MTKRPALALLLDVDGPIASPITRSISEPGLAANLVALAHAGIPVIFNTGRSDDFIASVVMPALRAEGLNLTPEVSGDAPTADVPTVFAICEKGATLYLPGSREGEDIVRVNDEYKLPDDVLTYCRELSADYTDVMFWDETKHAMASVEAHPGMDMDAYRERQASFDAAVWAQLELLGRPAVWGTKQLAGSGDFAQTTPVRIDTTIISTDVELTTTGKDLGADVALAELERRGIAPQAWRTAGDSRGDYAMADRLHELGHDVRHVDVRPAEGIKETPYPVDIAKDPQHINDVAGAQYIAAWNREIVAAQEGAQEGNA